MANDIGVPCLDLLQAGFYNDAHTSRVGGQVLSYDLSDVGAGCRATDGVSRVGAGHRAGRKLVHNLPSANDRRQGERAADAFATANHIGHDAIVLEGPELAAATKASLHFVEDQQ